MNCVYGTEPDIIGNLSILLLYAAVQLLIFDRDWHYMGQLARESRSLVKNINSLRMIISHGKNSSPHTLLPRSHSLMDWCIATLWRIVADIPRFDERQIDGGAIDMYHVQLELVYRELVALEAMDSLDYEAAAGTDHVRTALRVVSCLLESGEYESDTVGSGHPRFHIRRNQLAFLLEKRFTVLQISEVSIRTMWRRMTDYGLSVHSLYEWQRA